MKNPTRLERLVASCEKATALDKPADWFASTVRRIVRPGVIEDTLSGTPIGHPVHPVLVPLPIGAWVTALVLDLTAADGRAARRATMLGNLAALPTALTGANDWLSTTGPQRRIGLIHAAAMDGGLVLHLAGWVARGRGRRARGTLLAVLGLGVVGAGGWLGGHLAYALGIGVDTTVFQQLPRDWLDVGAEDNVPANGAVQADADGVAVLLTRVDGAIVALADSCTHRGAPLHEGTFEAGCVTCPWHGSTFALSSGAVLSGPATRPQPALEVRVVERRVLLRRTEE